MRLCFILGYCFLVLAGAGRGDSQAAEATQKVYVLPVRGDIDRAMVYLVRRGVKEAMEARADVLIVDMDTNGGRVDFTEQIMQILGEFKGETVTYVNTKAFSAGSFISVATDKIYMAPQSVIGAAAPIMLSPGGTGVQEMPNTMEVKTVSAISALVRAQAEKHGHNVEVVQAMVDKSKELIIDGEVLNEKNSLLTLTDKEANKNYGDPPRPLLSLGTVESLDALIEVLGYGGAERQDIQPSGAEQIGGFLIALGPVLLIVGIIGVYIEFKTPGFGIPGIIGICAFALYFLGGYTAGLSGMEWVLVFVVGLALVAVELFVFPGTVIIGLVGAALMLTAIVMALVDLYPNPGPGPGLPSLPSFENPFRLSLQTIMIAMIGGGIGIWLLSRLLPRTPVFHTIVSESASAMKTEALQAERQAARAGQVGVTICALRPGGKARFGEEILDVSSEGDFLPEGAKVKIVGFRNNGPLVQTVD